MTRRVLPSLRNYSSWLVSNATILAAGIGDTALNVLVQELWKIYTNALTLLVSSFPLSGLPPPVDYLLDEDEDTLSFKPLDNKDAQRRYNSDVTGSRKPKWHDRGIQRQHPNVEMLWRIRDFLADGLIIQSYEVSAKMCKCLTMLTVALGRTYTATGHNIRLCRRWHLWKREASRSPPISYWGTPRDYACGRDSIPTNVGPRQ